MLPSYSFGAEGVEYGRKAPFYVPSSGPLTLPDDLLVKGDLTVNGTSTLVGNVAVGGAFSVGVGGVSTSGSLLTGSATTPGGSIFGYDGSSVRAPNFPRGLASQGTVTVTQGATGGVPGLVVTNAGIGGNPVRSVSVFNDQANPGTLISMNNGTDAGTIAYTSTQFQLSRPLNIPVQAGSSGNLTVGGIATAEGFTSIGNSTMQSNLLVDGGIYGASSSTAPNFPVGLVTTVPTVTKSGIDDPILNWDQTLVAGVGYKQDGPGTVYIPNDWQTNLTLPAGLIATFISYGIGNSTCNAVSRDGVVRQTTGSRTTPNITYFYLMRSANGINNTIVYVVQQGIATGATIPQ